MKKQLSFFLSALMTIICALGASFGAEGDLVDLMATRLKSIEINARLEPSGSLPNNDDSHQKIKQIEAFEVKFSGRVAFKEASLESVCLWCDDSRLAPDAALKVFYQIAGALRLRIGAGKLIKDVPSFEDASDPKKQVMLWMDENEIIVLSIDTYPIRSGLSLQRSGVTEWLAEMGADQCEYWNKTLKVNGLKIPTLSIEFTSNGSKNLMAQDMVSESLVQPPESKKTAKEHPTPPSSEPTSSVPWFVAVVLIVAVISLIWLLLKWRK